MKHRIQLEAPNPGAMETFDHFDSILDALKKERILDVETVGGLFVVREQCDKWFCLTLTPAQLAELGNELIQLSKTTNDENNPRT